MEKPKARRFARACDNCYRRRVKCYWKPPACSDCAKKGLECTFTTIDKTSSSGQKTHPRDDDATGINQAPDVTSHETTVNDPTEKHSNPLDGGAATSTLHQPTIAPLSGRAFLAIIEEFFQKVNHFFPIYSKELYFQRVITENISPESSSSSSEAPEHLSDLIIICSVYQHRAINNPILTPSPSSSSQENLSTTYLQSLLPRSYELVLAPPSIPTLQSLALLSLCLLNSPENEHSGGQLLAAAIRMSQSLDLHHLNTLSDLSPKERVERLRLFWCIYILDKKLCLWSGVPGLIDEDDVDVDELGKFPEDGSGIIGTMGVDLRGGQYQHLRQDRQNHQQQQVVNIFTARQRLARVKAGIWREVRTFEARNRSDGGRRRREGIEMGNAALREWAEEWFDYGDITQIRERWAAELIPLIADLHMEYFVAMMKANPDLPGLAGDVERLMGDGDGDGVEGLIRISRTCVDIARNNLRFSMGVKWSASPHIGDILQSAVSAVLIMLCSYRFGGSSDLTNIDFDMIQGWVKLFGKFAEVGNEDELRKAHDVSIRLMRGSLSDGATSAMTID